MTFFPRKRTQQLTSELVGTEIVLFDALSGKAIVLNRVSATIWELCDGKTPLIEIAERASVALKEPVTEEVVRYALRELEGKKLLQTGREQDVPLGPVLSRRELVVKLGASASILLPIVGVVAIPAKAGATAGGCVLGETPVQLADGRVLRADAIRSGMWLRSFDPDSGEVRDGRVAHVKEFAAPAIHSVFTERGDVLRASPSHLLIAGRGDVHGTALHTYAAGDSMLVYDWEQDAVVASRITAIQISQVPQTVYGVEMWSDEHTLVTAGVVSHNVHVKGYYPDGTPMDDQ